MTQSEFDSLISDLRAQAHTWLGDEAAEKLERLIAHAERLRNKVAALEQSSVN